MSPLHLGGQLPPSRIARSQDLGAGSPLLKRGVGFWLRGKDISHLQEPLTTSERGACPLWGREMAGWGHPVFSSQTHCGLASAGAAAAAGRGDPPGPTPTEGGSQEEGPGGEGAPGPEGSHPSEGVA